MKKRSILSLLVAGVMTLTQIPACPVLAAAPSVSGFTQPVQTPQTITQSAYESVAEQKDRIPNSAIESYVCNGGQYASSHLKYAFDDNIDTHWETGTPNSATHTNTVTVTFKNPATPGRIEYMCRHDGTQPKGSATQYQLYYSTTATGENFVPLTDGSYPGPYSNMVSIPFKETTMKRFRFEFKKCHEDWASMSELRFYKAQAEASPEALLSRVFTDKTYSALQSGVDAALIDKQLAQAKSSLSGAVKDKVVEVLNEGKRLVKNPNEFGRLTYTLSQRGNMDVEKIRTRTSLGFYSYDATGFYISPNETISVYADFDENGPAPTVVFGQFGEIQGSADSWGVHNWKREYSLKPGINIITAPNWRTFGPAAIYFNNDCAPKDQRRIPKVRLVGGTRFPLYIHGETDPAVFKAELDAYLTNIVADGQEAAHFDRAANNLTNKYFNICEAVSENTVLTSSATGCKRALNENPAGKTMWDTMDAWERMYDLFTEFSGFSTDPASPRAMPAGKYICRVFWVKNDGVGAYATTGYTAYNAGNGKKQTNNAYKDIFAYQNLTGGWGWGYYHEIGHQYDNIDARRGEVTNNLYSIAAQDYFKPYPAENRLGGSGGGGQAIWPKIKEGNRTGQHPMRLKNNANPEPTNQDGDNVWYQLAEIYQLLMAYDKESKQKTGKGLYAAMWQEFWDHPELFAKNHNRTAATENMAFAMSRALGKDITAHFENYKHVISAAAKQRTGVNQLPKSTAKTWYADPVMRDPNSAGFANPAAIPIVNSTGAGANFKLTLRINETPNALLCYEIWQGGTLLGVTYNNEFAVSNGNTATTYKVIAYDRTCQPSQPWQGKPGDNGAADPAADNAAIAAAKTAIEKASYTATQSAVTTAEQAKAAVTSVIGGLNLNGVAATVVSGVFTAATAGTESNINGTDGGYTFTVKLSKGIGTPVTTAQRTLTITAAKYIGGNGSIGGFPVKLTMIAPDASNKYAAWYKGNEDGTGLTKFGAWTGPSEELMSMELPEAGVYYAYLSYMPNHYIIKNYTKFVRFIIDGSGRITNADVYLTADRGTGTPSFINVTAPQTGSAPYLSHNNGSDVTIVTFGAKTAGRGDTEGQASVTGGVTVPEPDVPEPDPTADNDAISAAKAAVETASYTGTQAAITDIAQAKAAVEAVIGGLSLNGVTAIVTNDMFTAAVAGTQSDPEGTDGSYTFTVHLSKGIGAPAATAQLTLTVTASAYMPVTFPIAIKAAKVDSAFVYGTWMKGNLSTAFAPCTWKGDSRSGMPTLYTGEMRIAEPGTYYFVLAATKRWAYDATCKVIEVIADESGNVTVQGYDMVGSSLSAKNSGGKLSYNPTEPSVLVVSWGGIPDGNVAGTPADR